MSLLRLYAPSECGEDGYPPEWHRLMVANSGGRLVPHCNGGIKDHVRIWARHRCVRCLHPWPLDAESRPDGPEWSPCDAHCKHQGPYRWEWNDIWEETGAGEDVNTAGQVKQLIGDRAIEARWRILTVHHLDGNKANCRWWNLAALCQRCHLTVQGRVRMERVYPWPHSDWFKPYVAGYYALTYLGEELDREQTEARLDELLGLELAA